MPSSMATVGLDRVFVTIFYFKAKNQTFLVVPLSKLPSIYNIYAIDIMFVSFYARRCTVEIAKYSAQV